MANLEIRAQYLARIGALRESTVEARAGGEV